VTLIAGYGFPRELFYPATYNGEEVQFWDADWLAAHPEVAYDMSDNIDSLYEQNLRAYNTIIRTAGLYWNMPNSISCLTIDSMLERQGKGFVEYENDPVCQNAIAYFEQEKIYGNEMLWNYFRPGVEHTYGEPFTYTTTETVHHDAETHTETVIDGYKCSKCGATKSN
jgi:hypothetical protein